MIILSLAVCLLLVGCSNSSGPDESALPPLETAPVDSSSNAQRYDSYETVIIYQETLSNGVVFELYEDGRLILSGNDIEVNIGDEKTFQSYEDRITTIELGDGISIVGDKAFSGLTKVQKLVVGDSIETIGYSALSYLPTTSP